MCVHLFTHSGSFTPRIYITGGPEATCMPVCHAMLLYNQCHYSFIDSLPDHPYLPYLRFQLQRCFDTRAQAAAKRHHRQTQLRHCPPAPDFISRHCSLLLFVCYFLHPRNPPSFRLPSRGARAAHTHTHMLRARGLKHQSPPRQHGNGNVIPTNNTCTCSR